MARGGVGAAAKKLAEGQTVLFIDEACFALRPTVQAGWSPKGTAPVLRHSHGSWRKLPAISAIAVHKDGDAYQARLIWRLHEKGTVASSRIKAFLHQCRSRIAGAATVVWDNASHHKSRTVRALIEDFGWTRLQLPSYCPELNPDENVWNWTKHKDLANLCSPDHATLARSVRASLHRLSKRPNILRWCLWNTELPWSQST